MSVCVLIVDDDPVQRRLLEATVSRFGYRAVTAESGEAALAALTGRQGAAVRAMVLDLVMPGLDGLGVLQALAGRPEAPPVIVQTARGSVETAVEAMRAGAFDFVVKPTAPERLKSALDSALAVAAQAGRARKARRGAAGTTSFADIVTGAPAMQRVLGLGRKAAASDIPILIEGESGVGKELVARAIQAAGPRRDRPFVTVNCGAIPENLVESILFGHEKGAFTGATERHTGKFVEADGGTLFLDEIGDLPADVQVKLLRAVQSGEVDPVGGRGTVRVDIRLISATNRDLLQRVRDGAFREDLYYRLNVFPITVPPLRARREDIPALVQHFLARLAEPGAQRQIAGITSGALALLQRYDWPGNIRQLENAVFRALVLCEGDRLTVDDFPQISAQLDGIAPDDGAARGETAALAVAPDAAPDGHAPERQPAEAARREPEAAPFGILRALDERGNVRPLADLECELIRLAIDHYDGQMSEVARRLGIGRSTLYRKLKEMGIEPGANRADRMAS
ncbi:sigma-54 dependent transcriptional regulator [Aquibium sp. A9E412]|uniref:sigma-54-dependent transcriptional regulator n=1 Tax=Aquibium sp. A9E412 TaxID=2976767 RepID=UPI0025B0E99E|nr:sigma-54 dependent transcriptional regulator [Aquibium sp. A9E412]MDN2565027.1 sigma-54 dependent transcriptional regulator [Aquibium sp. A9E412]